MRLLLLWLSAWKYKWFIKPIFFLCDPETVHSGVMRIGEIAGSVSFIRRAVAAVCAKKDSHLAQELCGIRFESPIGLAAGFDYDARLIQILPSLGFGFHTIGSITYGAYEGNPKPRLGRLPKSRSLMVNKGLKNIGAEAMIKKLQRFHFEIPLGVSVAKTNSPDICTDEAGIRDYVQALRLFREAGVGTYYELNVSCPNTFGGEPFTTPERLHSLLTAVDGIGLQKPLFIKMPVDLNVEETARLMEAAAQHCIQGFIFGNLTKDRTNSALDPEEVRKFAVGNFSGKPTYTRSNELIRSAYKKYGTRFVIIGCGGVFSAEDAYEKIMLGASLVQLITGMVYRGPQLVAQINEGLAAFLKRDGFASLREVIGSRA